MTSNVEGARITLDGKSEPLWVTPCTFPDLPTGVHTVVVSKPGYINYQQTITIERGRTTALDARRALGVGEINLATDPPGVDVLIDGHLVGPSPVKKLVGPGQHTYTLRVAGVDLHTNTFEIPKDGALLTRRFAIIGMAHATGVVEVRTIPPRATVLAEGKAVGGRTPTSFRLVPGKHTLTISLPGFAPLQKEVDVPAGKSIAVSAKLKPQ